MTSSKKNSKIKPKTMTECEQLLSHIDAKLELIDQQVKLYVKKTYDKLQEKLQI